MIGIAGDSGTGKNLLSEVALDAFDRSRAALLEGDDYHKWERGNVKWSDYTHLHPKANQLDALALHTSALFGGRHVWQPHYDHATGTFTSPRRIGAAHVVIVQGLHTLYLRDMRAQLDLKVFLAPDELVRLSWKIGRDVGERGHSRQKVLESLARRRADADLHIQPQRALADWIIEATPAEPTTREAILAGHVPRLTMHHVLWNDAPVGELVAALADAGLGVSLQVVKDDIDRVRLSVAGEPTAERVAAIGQRVLAPLRPITRAHRPPAWRSGQHGLNQLVLLSLLARRGLRDTSYASLR
jgi:uridine kinase